MTDTIKINIYANNLVATQAIATQLAQVVSAGTIILLDGNLGSGKTTFMQAFGKALGIHTTIASPTFTLIDEYTEGRLPLYHIDLYRLERSQVGSLHLEEYWRGEDFPLGIVAIEWASKLPHPPTEHLKINLSISEAAITPKNNELSQLSKLNLKLDSDPLQELPESRSIEIVAHGKKYIKLLEHFQTSSQIFTNKFTNDLAT